ncbi:MAG: hypothetical protein II355_01300 [Bacteroidales bacterium]|nr:hypothetical protein [Bacteroidales bacterium]MBQ5639792.1 hypothetical protein [Bacteroidales bacterium]
MKGKILAWTIAIVLVALAAGAYFKFFFVFGEGVKAGELNQLVYKGWVWKTYEGRLIQTGFRSGSTGKGVNGIQSNEFNFSVVDEAIADSLMRCGGKMVELRYKEYNGTLPWRGMHKYIVDEIISVRDVASNAEVPVFIGE